MENKQKNFIREYNSAHITLDFAEDFGYLSDDAAKETLGCVYTYESQATQALIDNKETTGYHRLSFAIAVRSLNAISMDSPLYDKFHQKVEELYPYIGMTERFQQRIESYIGISWEQFQEEHNLELLDY